MSNSDISIFKDVMNTQAMTWIKNGIFVMGFVFGIVKPFYDVRQDIALMQLSIETIQKNHLQHIQDLSQTQKEQSTRIENLQEQLWIAIGEGKVNR